MAIQKIFRPTLNQAPNIIDEKPNNRAPEIFNNWKRGLVALSMPKEIRR
jgi:hypothetical protein